MSSELDTGRLKVLLVEDNADDAFLLERHLRRRWPGLVMTRVETAPDMGRALGRPGC